MKRIIRESAGQGMTEYILIVALIAIVVIAGVKLFGKKVDKGFKDAASKIEREVSR